MTFKIALAIVQEIAAENGCREKVVGDYCWAKTRKPQDEQMNSFRVVSCTRDGVVTYAHAGKRFTVKFSDYGFQPLKDGYWIK